MPAIHALPRPRLTERMGELTRAGLGFVHGAAGIGKTTAMVQLAEAWPGTRAWIRLDHGDSEEARLLSLLVSALDLPPAEPGDTIDNVIAALESREPASTLLVFDDLHSIERSSAEAAIARLVRYRPTHVTVLMASRHEFGPAFTGLVGPGEAMVIDFEDLRFRLWEVDDLMRSHLDIFIAPADLHRLCHYTDGWAAALRLFSVACRDAGPERRSDLISRLRAGSGVVHDYLTSEVLSSLGDDARHLLVSTSVFEQITPERADALLDSEGSRDLLRSIHAAGIFGDGSEATETYRCHELLRTHLLGQCTEVWGRDEATALQLKAAIIAEAEGSPAEAARYYARGGDFDAVRRILDANADAVSMAPGRWIEVLPQAMREQDPFVLLTSARQLVRHGDLTEARRQYRRAVDLLDAADGSSRTARQELRLVDAWLLGTNTPATGWIGSVRGLIRSGLEAAVAEQPSHEIEQGVAAILAGDLSSATSALRRAEETSGGLTAVAAGGLRLLAEHLDGSDEGCALSSIRRVQRAAKELDARAVERLVGAIARGGVGAGVDDPLAEECRRANDHLGAGLVHLVDGVALVHEEKAEPAPFRLAAASFVEGGYEELALIARCFDAAVTASSGETPVSLGALETAARRSGGLAQLVVLTARATLTPDPAIDEQITRLGRRGDLGMLIGRLRRVAPPSATNGSSEVRVSVLGSFGVEVGSVAVACELTPLHHEVLAYLAVEAGAWVHKDRLMAAFWPDKDDARARRSLQVAISKVRLELERTGAGTVERDGARYSFVPAAGVTVDLLELRELLATPAAPLGARVEAVERALRGYGELVEDLGAAEWAVEARRQLRHSVSRVAQEVAGDLVDHGDLSGAGRVAEAGVRVDPGADGLWRLAITHAGSARSGELRARYERVLQAYAAPDDLSS